MYRMLKSRHWSALFIALASVVLTLPSSAQVSEDEAAELGKTLTPIGAEQKGNGSTIPEWTGGLTEPPANYQTGTHLIDPFPDDKPLFTITQDNLALYKNKLSVGQLTMFKQHPKSYRMVVYPSRRTAALPQSVYADATYNATHAKLTDGGNGVTDFRGYVPFPIPKNGLEVIWNHILRYRGGSSKRSIAQVITQSNGDFHHVLLEEEVVYPENMDGLEGIENMLVFFKQSVTEPGRLTGNVLLVHDTVNQVQEPRKAWIYNAGQRRVRRAPQVAYDGPGTSSDGLRTSDNFDMYNGAPDRYDWKLVGKQELYIPYNNYKLASNAYKYKDIIRPGHMNPDLLRYELHRVWKVEATLKEGQRHIYTKRAFYIDEDSWQIAVVDHYDSRGEFWRLSEAYGMQVYYADIPLKSAEGYYDITNNRYLVIGLQNEVSGPTEYGHRGKMVDFTPAALRRSGRR